MKRSSDLDTSTFKNCMCSTACTMASVQKNAIMLESNIQRRCRPPLPEGQVRTQQRKPYRSAKNIGTCWDLCNIGKMFLRAANATDTTERLKICVNHFMSLEIFLSSSANCSSNSACAQSLLPSTDPGRSLLLRCPLFNKLLLGLLGGL